MSMLATSPTAATANAQINSVRWTAACMSLPTAVGIAKLMTAHGVLEIRPSLTSKSEDPPPDASSQTSPGIGCNFRGLIGLDAIRLSALLTINQLTSPSMGKPTLAHPPGKSSQPMTLQSMDSLCAPKSTSSANPTIRDAPIFAVEKASATEVASVSVCPDLLMMIAPDSIIIIINLYL